MSDRRRGQVPCWRDMVDTLVAKARARALRIIAARARLLAHDAMAISRQDSGADRPLRARHAQPRTRESIASTRQLYRANAQPRERQLLDRSPMKPVAASDNVRTRTIRHVRRTRTIGAVYRRSAQTHPEFSLASRGQTQYANCRSTAPPTASWQRRLQQTPAEDSELVSTGACCSAHTRAAARLCHRVAAVARRRIERRGATGGTSASTSGRELRNMAAVK